MECPFCHSQHVIATKRGYSWLYGLLGFFILSLFGLLFGFIGENRIRCHCLDCEKEWDL